MKWTTEKPTEPGWYFHRFALGDTPRVWKISSVTYGSGEQVLAVIRGVNSAEMLSSIHGEWAGPIEEPKG